MDDSRARRPRRRWYQFRLLTLLLFVVLVSVGMSWFAVKMHQARRQRNAVEAIEKSGGFVMYDYEFKDDGTPIIDADPPGPAWLRETLGIDFLWEVNTVVFKSDAGAEHLGWLASLEYALFCGPEVTDYALERLKGVTSFRRLRLLRTSITDAGLRHVKGLTNLESLEIYYAGITDDGLKHLEGLASLQTLWLIETGVTDAGLEHLNGLASLETLDLGSTGVTDAGLEHLKGLGNLRTVRLHGTNVTDEGVKKLQQALPNCEILH